MEMSESTLMRVSLTRAQAALDELRAKKLLPPPAGVGRGPSLMQIAAALAVRNGEFSVLGGNNIPQASQPSAAAKLFKVPVARVKYYLELFEQADATYNAGPAKQAQQAKHTNVRWRQAEQAPVHA